MIQQRRTRDKRKKRIRKRVQRQQLAYNSRGDYRTVQIGRQIADRLVAKYVYAEIPTNRFTTASTVGSILYYANSMYEIFVGGGQAIIPYYQTMRSIYNSYRVLKSTIKVVVTSREAVNGMELLVVPMDDQAVPSITNSTEYVNAASLRYARRVMVPPYVGGRSNVTLRATLDLSKFVGPEYLTDPAWGGGSASNPTRFVYWLVAYYNQNSNTVTTGGLGMQVTVTNLVEQFDPDSSEQVLFSMANPERPNTLLPRSQQIAVEMESLSKELSQLKQ